MKNLVNNVWFQGSMICLIEIIIFTTLAINNEKAKFYWFLYVWSVAFIFFIILTINQIYNERNKNI